MQWSSRLKVKAKNADIYERLYDQDFSSSYLEWNPFEDGDSEITIDGDWDCDIDNLEEMVNVIFNAIGKEAIIIADCTSNSVDPFTQYYYSVGGKLHQGCYQYDNAFSDLAELFYNSNIDDICDWLTKGKFVLTKKEEMFLKTFDIVSSTTKDGTKLYEKYIPNFGLPDEIELSGTQYEGRNDRIEHVKVGDEVKLVREHNNEYDSNAIDVQSNEGSLGHIEYDASQILAPIIDRGEKKYIAKISSVTPLSQRSKRCRSALISVHIDIL